LNAFALIAADGTVVVEVYSSKFKAAPFKIK